MLKRIITFHIRNVLLFRFLTKFIYSNRRCHECKQTQWNWRMYVGRGTQSCFFNIYPTKKIL